MTRIDTLKSEIARLQSKGAGLTKDLAKHRDAANKATAVATKKRDDARKTKQDSTRRSATSTAEREGKKAADATKKMGEVEKKIADNNKAIGSKETSLRSAERTEQGAADREEARRRSAEKRHVREVASLSRQTAIRYVEVQPPKPETLRVLYLTANPESVVKTVEHPDGSVETDGVWLRVDFEVRQVKDLLKKSKYRDLVSVEHLPAATSMDLLEGLNDHRPQVVHFSGHASSWGLLMDNDEGTTDGDGLDFGLLARLLGATDEPPTLVVLNACESLAGADDLLRTVPVVIGMSDEINDASAVVFAARFYSGIASAQSVASSLEQAKAAMETAALEGSHLPEARFREDVNLSDLALVKPPA